MRIFRQIFRLRILLILIALLAFPLSVWMRALNPPRARAIMIGPRNFHFSQPINTYGIHQWVIRNEGNLPLILQLNRATQCTMSDDLWDGSTGKSKTLTIAPGQEGTLSQRWKGFSCPGPRQEILEIKTNDPENPTLQFIVHGDNFIAQKDAAH